MKKSAGILLFRRKPHLEIFLVHPGGPFFKNKDDGAWSIPKGEYAPAEDPLNAAKREFFEETGVVVSGDFIAIGEIKQASGKIVSAWALEVDVDAAAIKSNTFEMEWPPKSGRKVHFPEVDRAEWFSIGAARIKILPAQLPFLDRIVDL
jgi:predicted NUDIX family NTP pyrophosphohydrolase